MKPIIAICIALVMAGSFSSCASSGATNTKLANKNKDKAKNLDEAARREALKEEVASKSTLLLGILGASGESDGTVANIFADGDTLSELFEAESGMAGIGTIGGSGPDSAAAVRDLSVEGEGQLEEMLVKTALDHLADQFTQCHKEQFYEEGALKPGKATLQLGLDAHGRVEAVVWKGSNLTQIVTDCIEESMAEARFPAPAGGPVEVTQTLILGKEAVEALLAEEAAAKEAEDAEE